jgi:hypothetical protein
MMNNMLLNVLEGVFDELYSEDLAPIQGIICRYYKVSITRIAAFVQLLLGYRQNRFYAMSYNV